tara:strand:+ start:12921 stop:13319 length:399 start_codon:yes stop_codon:yes gene_type:complete
MKGNKKISEGQLGLSSITIPISIVTDGFLGVDGFKHILSLDSRGDADGGGLEIITGDTNSIGVSGEPALLIRDYLGAVVFRIEANGSMTLSFQTAPATATSTGILGEIRYTTDYIYICTATNTWKRVAISTW